MRKENLDALKVQVLKTLMSLGYHDGLRIINKNTVSFYLEKTEKGILVEVINSHNSYLNPRPYLYRQVAKNLVEIGYSIQMTYPCYITVTEHVE